MRIFARGLRAGFRPFLFWTLGMALLILAGMTKYTGLDASAGSTVSAIIEKFPRIVVAVLGIVDVDINTLGGYYAVLSNYVLICVCLYAVYLGGNAVSREFSDKTFEFLFTKPRTRRSLLTAKLVPALVLLFLFCTIILIFSLLSVRLIGLYTRVSGIMLLYFAANLLVGMLFFSISVFLSCKLSVSEKGQLYANLIFACAFFIGVISDMSGLFVLRIFTPLKFFTAPEILSYFLNPLFIILCIAFSWAFLRDAYKSFDKRDLLS